MGINARSLSAAVEAKRVLLGLGALLLVTAGCVADSADDHDARSADEGAAHVVLEEEAEDTGETLALARLGEHGFVRFYQTSPGIVMIEEGGSLLEERQRDPEEEHMNPVELYEYLSGEPAPEALVAAVEEVGPVSDAQVAQSQTLSAPAQLSSVPKSSSAEGLNDLSHYYFRQSYCRKTDRYYGWLNSYGPGSIKTSGTNFFNSGVYAINGTMRFRANAWDGTFRQIQTAYFEQCRWRDIARNHYRYIRVHCKNCTVEVKTDGPNTVLYDFCTNFHY